MEATEVQLLSGFGEIFTYVIQPLVGLSRGFFFLQDWQHATMYGTPLVLSKLQHFQSLNYHSIKNTSVL